ncbi:HAD-IIIA family hydrolase [Salinisphaera sp. SPP-AMP-43]|uniref:KdsC family phosphatase n=1 Tax=Salinisphaera sp. SPP-AMP-43 TaxID=3121288 RepID=UPI003C6DE824
MSFLNRLDSQYAVSARAAAVRLAVFDVDGVMTDGKLYLGPDGSETKSMHVRDGLGLKRLAEAGVEIAVISGRPSPPVAARLSGLGIDEVHMACDDKPGRLADLSAARGLKAAQIAVMGDDLPDLEIMSHAGLALAVADAVPEVRRAAHWVSALPGGHGAVREACELLIAAVAAD